MRSEFQVQKNVSQKSIPEHIIDGSIGIDSIEAFASILKQYPNHPGLLIKYSDLLLHLDLIDLAAKSYGEASKLFIASGNLLQAVVAKKFQWLIKPPPNKDIYNFLSVLAREHFVDSPLKLFLDKLSTSEKLAIISSFVRTRISAGQTLKKNGEQENDLYFVVSGTLKDSVFASLETKETVHRKSNVYLSDDDFFGNIYPFEKDIAFASDIVAVTQAELVKISKQELIKLCRYYPNIELALIHLCKIRSTPEQKSGLNLLRGAERDSLPIKMVLEIPPANAAEKPISIEGVSSDISIGGTCIVLNTKSEHIPNLLSNWPKDDPKKKIMVSLASDAMELKVKGKIVWRHQIQFNGRKALAVGIQFDDDTPKMRGMLLMFARSLGKIDSTSATA
jgi:CRP-like cAMP-binding protein